ncbi:sodium/hydrogen exchanger, partial [Gregarina niphandrodes]
MVSHNIAVQTAALTSVMLMCAFICGHLINISKLRNIPQSTAGILIGAFSGLLIFYWNPKLFGNKSLLNFNPELFYMFMLPPIILEAGFSMDRINFIKNFHSIMWLAIGGTLLSAILTAAGLYIPHLLSSDYGFFEGSLTEKLLYCTLLGTLLAAVDPVATLGVLGGSRFEANEKLFSIVFGESLLNDSVSIVLFRTLTLLSFMYVTLISCIIGAVTGLIAYLAFRLAGGIQRFPEYELGVLLLIAYFSFSVAEMVEGSGIVSLFITAVLLGHYNIKNLSLTSQRSSVLLFKVLSVFSESFIYLLFGTVFTRSVIAHAQFDLALVAWTTALLMLSRGAVVFPSAAIINALERKHKSYAEEQKETQVIAGACMHAVFEKHLTSRYTPLAKSLCATERPTQDNSSSPYTQFDDEDELELDSRAGSSRPYRPGEAKAGAAGRALLGEVTPPGKASRTAALPQIAEHASYDINVVPQSPRASVMEAPAPVCGDVALLGAGPSEHLSVSRGGVAFRPP